MGVTTAFGRVVARIGRDGRYWLVLAKGQYRARINSTPAGDGDPLAVVKAGLNIMAFDAKGKHEKTSTPSGLRRPIRW